MPTALRWLGVLRAKCAECMDKIRSRKDGTGDAVAAQAAARMRLGWAQRSGAGVALAPGPDRGEAAAGREAGEVEGEAPGAAAAAGAGGGAVLGVASPGVAAHLLATLPEHPDGEPPPPSPPLLLPTSLAAIV